MESPFLEVKWCSRKEWEMADIYHWYAWYMPRLYNHLVCFIYQLYQCKGNYKTAIVTQNSHAQITSRGPDMNCFPATPHDDFTQCVHDAVSLFFHPFAPSTLWPLSCKFSLRVSRSPLLNWWSSALSLTERSRWPVTQWALYGRFIRRHLLITQGMVVNGCWRCTTSGDGECGRGGSTSPLRPPWHRDWQSVGGARERRITSRLRPPPYWLSWPRGKTW